MTARQLKDQKLLWAPQSALGTPATPDANTTILPAENISFNLDRGSGLQSRSGINFGGPGSPAPVMGSIGWSVNFDAEIHDSVNPVNPSLTPLIACGMICKDDGGEAVFTLAHSACSLKGWSGSLPEGPGVGTAYLVENCGVTYKAQDVTGKFSLSFEADSRILANYEMKGRIPQTGDVTDCITATTGTEKGWGTTEHYTDPMFCEGLTVSINGSVPTNLQSFNVDVDLNIEDQNDQASTGGMGIIKPQLDEYITFTFTAAQDSNNEKDFWDRALQNQDCEIVVKATSLNGGELTLTLSTCRFAPPTVEDVTGRRYYAVEGMAHVDMQELALDRDDAYAQMFELRYKPVPVASS